MARKSVQRTRRAGGAVPGPSPKAAPAAVPVDERAGLRPWHLLLVATLVAIAAGVFVAQGTSTVNSVSLGVAIATVALAAAAVVRTVSPLLSPEIGEQTEMLGGRTRAALEREKMLVLRSIKEVEFDRAMRKISDADYHEVAARLRGRAAGLMRQLDGDGSGYRSLIERELVARVGPAPARPAPGPAADSPPARRPDGECHGCGTLNDVDARFCKSCGTRMEETR